MNGMVWLRSDLRMDDNPAFSVADSECKKLLVYTSFVKEWKYNNANVKLDLF